MIRKDGWTVSASRVYEYVRGSFKIGTWTARHDGSIWVGSVADALDLPIEEVQKAGEKMDDEVPRAMFHIGDEWSIHGYWTQMLNKDSNWDYDSV